MLEYPSQARLQRWPKYSTRPFFLTILVLTIIIATRITFDNQGFLASKSRTANPAKADTSRRHYLRKRDEECRFVHSALDQCAFVRANCTDEEAGLLSYLQLYFCRLHGAKPVALVILIAWLGLLFSTIGIAASDFFCVNLSTISTLLGLSESMAGVTFLAFGNGSPDVFSTYAAMSTHSGSLAIGELIGAAGFITAVVAGSMALVRPFKVAKRSFVRDVSFFIVAASFSMVFLADGRLTVWECVVMVVFYVFYVVFVVVWHWVLGRRRRRKQRDARARSHFLTNDAPDNPAEDEADEDAAADRGMERRRSFVDEFVTLERAGQGSVDDLDDEDHFEVREQWMAEINRNMRVNRPISGQRRNAGNTIRPSLVGALEFRAVLSSLEKSRSQQAIPIHLRRYSDDPTYTLAQQQRNVTRGASNPQVDQLLKTTNALQVEGPWRPSQESERDRPNRNRAVSANDAYDRKSAPINPSVPRFDLFGPSPPGTAGLGPDPADSGRKTSSLLAPSQSKPMRCTVPTGRDVGDQDESRPSQLREPRGSASSLSPCQSVRSDAAFFDESPQPEIPRLGIGRQWSNTSLLLSPGTAGSSPAMPFPPYHDDPNFVGPPLRANSIRLPPASLRSDSFLPEQHEVASHPKPIRWWPYRLFPPPGVLLSTLFPTLYSWKQKRVGERILGVIAAPSVLLLTITLPVVEADKNDPASDSFVDQAGRQTTLESRQSNGMIPPPLITLDHQPENDGITLSSEPDSIETNGSENGPTGQGIAGRPDHTSNVSTPERVSGNSADLENIDSSHDPGGWNRWLVSTQVFTAPFFVVLIVWANMDEEQSPWTLLSYVAYVMIGSLLVFAAILLTTTESKAPRYRSFLCFVGFVVSVAWISTIASEVVGVLKALGVILGISDAILGLTVFAVGNSLGDLVADITVAKLGYPVMALSACFGGPMLNILLGIGISGLYMTIKEGKSGHSGNRIGYKPYHIEVGGTLIISGITLLVTLVGLLVAVPLNNWVMDRKIGWSLIAIWCASTIVNVAVEVTGVARDQSWLVPAQ